MALRQARLGEFLARAERGDGRIGYRGDGEEGALGRSPPARCARCGRMGGLTQVLPQGLTLCFECFNKWVAESRALR